uniref:Uncharacterized protein n=1 Tax=Candidatus Kentrum sp. LPFa TaxID=2126335 RepID=A0A450X1A9_9GAMM|nr:MAG: hypothetical protein BECKLPF1236A_GA0070988_1000516 [Candidatus Kentron sp. LPFa]VFK23067.1 MAG: hypothetical protein BECKLPF1236C_GA0070990_1000314 [Candidatus Kentron sp. LPFa]
MLAVKPDERGQLVIPPSIFQRVNAFEDYGEYDLDNVNVAIAEGIAEAMAHQRGEIELQDAREALQALMDGR